MNKNNKTIIIFLLLLFQCTTGTFASNDIENINKLGTRNEDNKIYKKKSNIKIEKSLKRSKKLLYKEIKRRKKYHRNLLYLYTKNYDTNILKDITYNGLLLNDLRKAYNI